MGKPAEKPSDTATQRINAAVDTTLLLRVCNHVEGRERKRMQMAEVLTIVLTEYAKQNDIA